MHVGKEERTPFMCHHLLTGDEPIMCVHTYIHTYACMYVCMYVCMYTCAVYCASKLSARASVLFLHSFNCMDVRTYIYMYVCMYVPELRHTGRKPLLQLQQPMQCVPVVTGDLVAVSCAVEEDPYTGHRSIDLAGEGRGEEGRRKEKRRGRRRKRHRSCAINLYLEKMPIT